MPKDYTQYKFNGAYYGKGRLVLAVIEAYVRQHPTITYHQLKNKFPDSLQRSETFTHEHEAIARVGIRRNFVAVHEIIQLVDARIAVSNQWGINNIHRFLDRCRELGIEITAEHQK